jgi:nucleoside-diphosphate-sugar epimerase
MKILFIGGTGTISGAVTELATERGYDLSILNRGNKTENLPPNVRFIKGDIRDFDGIKEKLQGDRFDVVVNWIGYYPEQLQTDLNLFQTGLKQYIFISSASAYQKPPSHYRISESTPLANPFWKYAQEKIACERFLLNEYQQNRFPVTIVRPSHTYHQTIPYIFNSKKVIVPGDGTSLWTLTHGRDFAKGFLGLLGNRESIGQAFHITSDEVLTWERILLTIAEAVGVTPRIIHLPSDLICAYSPDHYGSIMGDKSVSVVFDNRKIKKYVPDFEATIPFSEGIKQSLRRYQANPQLCGVDEEFDQLTDDLIESCDKAFKKA